MDDKTLDLPVFDRYPDAIALDLDGTLFDSRTRISARNRKAIEACIAEEIPVVIVTSRPVRAVRRFLGNELVDRCSLVLQNGAIAAGVSPLSGNTRETIPAELATEIIETIKSIEPEIRLTIELEGHWFGTNMPRPPDELWEFNSATPDMQRTLEEALAGEPTKIAAGIIDKDLSVVVDVLEQKFAGSISVVPADGMTFLNITSIRATKPGALRQLMNSIGKGLDNVVAFGDDFPDIGLLRACGISVAVANAIPDVKAAADYCTASNDDDGVALVLEMILETGNR